MRLSLKETIKIWLSNIYDLSVLRFVLKRRSVSSICLMYHDITSEIVSTNRWTLPIKSFINQISILENEGYKFVAPSEILLGSDYQCCITFDDACMGASLAFDFLLSREIPFTLFVAIDLLDKPGFLSSKYIKSLSISSLVTIGSHTNSHPERLDMQSLAIQKEEIGGSKVSLESLTGQNIEFFSYPHGRFSAETILISKECGYKYCFTSILGGISQATNPRAIPRIEIWSRDTNRIFIQKIRGSWDWLNWFRSGVF